MGLNRAAINRAHVVIHFCARDEKELPTELTAAIRFGTPVIRYEVGSAPKVAAKGEATLAVNRIEELIEAAAEALITSIH